MLSKTDVLLSARKARVFYQSPTATLCDICEGQDCENVCTTDPETQLGADTEGKGSGSVASPVQAVLYTILILYMTLTYN